ncbi:MAG: hypothetical protein ACFHWZ_07355 [Phycisphaerales bacterium]
MSSASAEGVRACGGVDDSRLDSEALGERLRGLDRAFELGGDDRLGALRDREQ